MATLLSSSPFPVYQLLILLFIFTTIAAAPTPADQKQTYIVYLGEGPGIKYGVSQTRTVAVQSQVHLLSSIKGIGDNVQAKSCILRSYTSSFNAFAAQLTKEEAEELNAKDQVVSVFPSQVRKLHTTQSWDFLKFPIQSKRNPSVESDIIVGVIDTGIWPDSDSFKDTNFGPVPAKWKGTCHNYANFSGCNRKLIGAWYSKIQKGVDEADILSPVDTVGHGTHVAATVAGNVVEGASVHGVGNGVARGAVPSARIAMYKVCWATAGCKDEDIMAAFDQAIKDGVDIISISIGGLSGSYVQDSIAIGAFHAMQKGILTVASGGNDGPESFTLDNHAPWILTVAASAIDRQFLSKIELGNGQSYYGSGVNIFEPQAKSYPLVLGRDVAANPEVLTAAEKCYYEALDPTKVNGKIVQCMAGRPETDAGIKLMGGSGSILVRQKSPEVSEIYSAPATTVNISTANLIYNYINQSAGSATAVIHKSEGVKIQAPFIAWFSSRGPHQGSPRLLKPDIAAPGLNILAAFSPYRPIAAVDGKPLFSKYTIISGTSMACPHAAGVAAYIKSFHPDWSPAAIKSAIITTATPMSKQVDKDGEFAYGAGQINPTAAVDPGLIYDTNELSYVQFLCDQGYPGHTLAPLTNVSTINCTTLVPGKGYDALNYPTFQVFAGLSEEAAFAVFKRDVTNVGPAQSVYNVTVQAPEGVVITVLPKTLTFTHSSEKKSYGVLVRATRQVKSGEMLSGELVWRSEKHSVRSPIVVFNPVFPWERPGKATTEPEQ